MSNFERTSVTLTKTHFLAAKTAIEQGQYASMSEVIRDAMREWVAKHNIKQAAYKVEDLPDAAINAIENAVYPTGNDQYNDEA